MDLPGFDRFEFDRGGIKERVYRCGTGPGVIVMHELPGMVPECVALAKAIAAADRLRVDDLRVFYDVESEEVRVLAIVAKSDADVWLRQAGQVDENSPALGSEG